MKKLVMAICVVVLFVFSATPVFADDPPGIEVDIDVVTPDDVTLGVDVTAGGDVDVVIDGTSYPEAIDNSISSFADGMYGTGAEFRPPIDKIDWYYYFNKEMKPYAELLKTHNSILGLLADAQAGLIQGQELTDGQVALLVSLIDELKLRDDVIWDQLINGAERHITVLDSQLVDLGSRVDSNFESLRAEDELLKLGVRYSQSNYSSLLGEMRANYKALQLFSWMMGAVILILIAAIILMQRQIRNRG